MELQRCRDCPEATTVEAFCGSAVEVAFEAFFGEAFFGARCKGTPQEVIDFATRCTNAFAAATCGESFFRALFEPNELLHVGRKPVKAEAGAVNAWKSLGAHSLELPTTRNAEEVWREHLLSELPFAKSVTHKKAIELAFDHPLHHWFAMPISESEPPYALSRMLLTAVLAEVAVASASIAVEAGFGPLAEASADEDDDDAIVLVAPPAAHGAWLRGTPRAGPAAVCWLDAIAPASAAALRAEALHLASVPHTTRRGTHWIENDKATCSCGLERLAQSVLTYHTARLGLAADACGCEWWVQVRHGPPTNEESIGFHYDSDETHKAKSGEHVPPYLATVTYLSTGGAPTPHRASCVRRKRPGERWCG